MTDLRETFGDIDIYLFDQLLKRRLRPPMSILDAGCGYGRNLQYFLRSGFAVSAVDLSAEAIAHVRGLARRLAPALPAENFMIGDIAELQLPSETFDAVICNAVLHFASDAVHFHALVDQLWRVLKKDGILFVRLASSIGVEDLLQPLGECRYTIPDGTDRFLVDQKFLLAKSRAVGGRLIDPLKTTVVQDQRAMSTWVMRKETSNLPCNATPESAGA